MSNDILNENISEKVKKYEHFIDNVLKEDLKKELEIREGLYEKVASFSQLKQNIEIILKSDLSDGLNTQIDLGSNFYVQAHVPDASKIYVNIGLGFHLEMCLENALKFCDKKIENFIQEIEGTKDRTGKIKANIKFVFQALKEIQGLDYIDQY